jgi:hypothetical protein
MVCPTRQDVRLSTRRIAIGVAQFTTQDHSQWKLVLDRVQTKDVPTTRDLAA